MMDPVNIHQAKTQLSQLLQVVEQGEEVVIARAGVPIARLVGWKAPARLGCSRRCSDAAAESVSGPRMGMGTSPATAGILKSPACSPRRAHPWRWA